MFLSASDLICMMEGRCQSQMTHHHFHQLTSKNISSENSGQREIEYWELNGKVKHFPDPVWLLDWFLTVATGQEAGGGRYSPRLSLSSQRWEEKQIWTNKLSSVLSGTWSQTPSPPAQTPRSLIRRTTRTRSWSTTGDMLWRESSFPVSVFLGSWVGGNNSVKWDFLFFEKNFSFFIKVICWHSSYWDRRTWNWSRYSGACSPSFSYQIQSASSWSTSYSPVNSSLWTLQSTFYLTSFPGSFPSPRSSSLSRSTPPSE